MILTKIKAMAAEAEKDSLNPLHKRGMILTNPAYKKYILDEVSQSPS